MKGCSCTALVNPKCICTMLQASLSTQISQGELARTVTYRKIDGQGNQDLIEAHVWIDFLTLLCVCTGYFGGTSATQRRRRKTGKCYAR